MRISVAQAIQFLSGGKVVAIPTETVYGLAASITDSEAIDQIFTLKGRPSSNPLIVHLANPKQLFQFVTSVPPQLELLIRAFWPGPLTFVLPVDPLSIPVRARSGLPTAAFRVPSHPLALDVLQAVGPLVMPSANRSGKPSGTSPEHVENDFGSELPILDGGRCKQGLESTIVMYQQEKWSILRLGSITAEAIATVIGYQPEVLEKKEEENPLCPGQMFKHYAPKARLHLTSEACSTVIGFVEREYPQATKVFLLGSLSNSEQVAKGLYTLLRQLDLEGVEEAGIDMDFPRHGLWATIAERLSRASSK